MARLVACGWSAAACAQGAPDIVVTAARTEGVEALGGATVGRAELERLAAPTVLDALGRVAGVTAFARGGAGGSTFLSVRGGEPNFTLVLVDGVKVNDPTNAGGGAFDLSQLDPALVERIEVYRGAVSAVHGSDALSGVVGVRLRAPEAGASASATGSSEGEAGAAGTLGFGDAATGLLLGAGGYDSGDLARGSHFSRAHGLAKGAARAGAVGLTGFGLYARTRRDGLPEESGGPRLAVSPERERREGELFVVGATAGLADAGRVAPAVRASWTRQEGDADTPAIAPAALGGVPAIRAATAFERVEAALDVRGQAGRAAFAAGGAWLDERGRGEGAVDFGFPVPADFRLGRTVASGYAEASWRSAVAAVTASARHDAPSRFRARWTGRVSARVTPWSERGPAASVSYGEGFKLPSLYALAYPLIANPDLRPETGRSWEAALEQRLPGGRVRAAVYETRYRDLIDFDAERFINVNRARVVARGVEGEAEGALSATLRARASVAYVDLDNRGGPPLRSRPDWRGSAAIEWDVAPAWRLWAGGETAGRAFDLSVPTGQIEAGGRTTVDAGARWTRGRVAVELTARNLLAERYEETVGFPAPGRVVRLTVRAAR